jgi:signal transduction histidine kinase
MRLTIFQKGLLLVSVPLAFEIAFVSYLSNLLHNADLQIKREQHAKDVILHMDRLRRNWTESAFHATTYAYVHNPMLAYKYKEVLNEIDEEMQKMRELCKDNPKQMQILTYLDDCNNDQHKLLKWVQHQPEPLKALFPMISLTTETHPFIRERKLADQLIAQEYKVLDAIPAERRANREQIQNALWGAIGFNIILTVFFTGYLARNITGRLRSVMANTRRMVNRQELLPQVGGGDEIAELDRSIHQTANELAELEKFKRELTAMVTHELRTPLTSIQGVLTLLRLGALGELPKLAGERVVVAEANSQRLIRLINDLLDIERMEAGKLEMHPEPCSTQEIIDQSIEAVREFASQNRVMIENDKTQCWVNADAERIVQVVINFLSNAIKYSEKESRVTVATKVLGDGFVEVRVTDSGRGIPPEAIHRIFEKFEQVDGKDRREKKGTGLGLAICKGIIDQHQGKIGVDSEVGKGSTFWFKLPQAAPRETTSVHADGELSRT